MRSTSNPRASSIEDARQFLTGEGLEADAIAPLEQDKFMSAFVRAKKLAGCCAPGSCS
jgi:arsenite methyltransferase